MRFRTLVLLLVTTFFLANCSALPDSIYTPRSLVSLDANSVKFKKYWLDSVGIGDMWRGYNLRPALANNILVTTDVEGWIRAFNVEQKTNIWNYQVKQGVSAPLVIGDNKVFLATQNGEVLALNLANGIEVWKTDLNKEVLAISAYSYGMLALSTSDDKIIALDSDTGIKKWQYVGNVVELTLSGAGAPLVTSLLTYAPMANGKLVALDNDTGALRFETTIANATGTTPIENLIDLDTSPQIISGIIFVAGFNGNLAGIEAFSGRKVWQMPYSTYNQPLIEGDMVYLTDEKSQIHALNFRSGETIWTQEALYGRDVSAPVFFGDYIALADSFGYLHVLDKNTGKIVGRTYFDAQGVITPLVSDGKNLIVVGRRGKLGVFRVDENIW